MSDSFSGQGAFAVANNPGPDWAIKSSRGVYDSWAATGSIELLRSRRRTSMSFYVLVADKCQADAKRHGQSSLVANLRESIERTQNLTGFDFFLPTSFLKKKPRSQLQAHMLPRIGS